MPQEKLILSSSYQDFFLIVYRQHSNTKEMTIIAFRVTIIACKVACKNTVIMVMRIICFFYLDKEFLL